MKTYIELEKAVDWLLSSKSPMVDSNAPIQQHVVSNITSIRRIAKMFNINMAEALLMTHQGLSNGFHAKKAVSIVKPAKAAKATKKIKKTTSRKKWSKAHRERFLATMAAKRAAKQQEQPATEIVQAVEAVEAVDKFSN